MKNWEKRKLGNICGFVRGPFGGSLKKNIFTTEGYAVYEQQHAIYDQFNDIRYFIDENKFNEMKRFELKSGDLIMSCSGTMGKIAIVPENIKKGIINQALLKLSPSNQVSNVFLKLWMQSESFQDSLKEYSGGAAIQNVASVVILKQIEIPLPPLPEQHRIVSILDEAFAAIATAKANAEQNLKNTKELFDSYLQNIFENKDDDWKEMRIQEITKVVNGYAFASKDFQSTNTIKSVKITNVGVKEFVEEKDNYLPEKFKETLKEYQVKEGDIVIALTRTIISAGLKVAVVPKSYNGALINQRVAALVPNEKLVNQRFFYYFLTTNGVSKYVLAHVNTLMQPNLSINDLKNMLVPCPPLKEQQTIVTKLDALSTETKRLEAIYQQKLVDLEELKKSVLQKAFNGEL
jgi:type I restriction enzyme S subunit